MERKEDIGRMHTAGLTIDFEYGELWRGLHRSNPLSFKRPYSFTVYKDRDKYMAEDWRGRIRFEDDDASEVIQSAVDNGKTVVIREGEYSISRRIDGKDNVSIVILNGAVLTLADGVNDVIFKAVGLKNFNIICHGVLDGNKSNQTSGHLIHYSDGCEDFRIYVKELRNAYEDGVFISTGSKTFTVRVDYVHDCGRNGVSLWDQVENAEVEFVRGYRNGQHTLWLANDQTGSEKHYSKNISIKTVIGEDDGYATLYIDSGSTYVSVGTVISINPVHAGVYIYGSDDQSPETVNLTHDIQIEKVIVYGGADIGGVFIYKCLGRIQIGEIIGYNTSQAVLRTDHLSPNRMKNLQIGSIIARNSGANGVLLILLEDSQFGSLYIENAQEYGLYIYDNTCRRLQFGRVVVKNSSQKSGGTYDGVLINSDDIVFDQIIAYDDQDTPTQRYGVHNYGSRVLIKSLMGSGNASGLWFDEGNAVVKGIGFENSGVAVFSGDGSTTTFRIEHGLVSTPSKYGVSPLTPDADASRTITVDDTYITITFDTAPPSGTDNVKFGWWAEV